MTTTMISDSDSGLVSIPEGLDGMAPGELGSMLASVDLASLSGFDRVVVLRAWNRQLAYSQARFYESILMVGVAAQVWWNGAEDVDLEDYRDAVVSELRAALSWTRRGGEYHYDLAGGPL